MTIGNSQSEAHRIKCSKIKWTQSQWHVGQEQVGSHICRDQGGKEKEIGAEIIIEKIIAP